MKNTTKKVALLLIIICVVSLKVYATDVNGIISSNTDWTLANSPYIVTGNILVSTGITLTIDPGVTVKFNSGLSMQIDGTLLAQGTSNNQITFTSNTKDSVGVWDYIYFSSASTNAVYENNIYGKYLSGSILEYCIIQYAGGASINYNGALRLESAPFINYCTISDNSASGIMVNNLNGNLNLNLKITNSTISNNVSSSGVCFGMSISNRGTTVLSGNTITKNIANGNGVSGIYVFGPGGTASISNNKIINNIYSGGGCGISVDYATATIFDNIITNNTGYGICHNVAATISDNLIINNAGGDINGGGGTISYNVIADNNSTGIFDYGTIIHNHIIRNISSSCSGINYSGNLPGTIKNNTITQNESDTSNTIFIPGTPAFTNNNIFANTSKYELKNGNPSGPPPYLNATNNWWGTTNDANIQQKIFDWSDNASLGIVTYSPYLSMPDTIAPVSPPENVIKKYLGNGQVKITWKHNPESDIAGYHLYYGNFTGYSFTNIINVGNDTSYTLTGVSMTDTIAVTAYDSVYSAANEYDSTIVNDNMVNGNESWYSYAKDPCSSIKLAMSTDSASCSTCNNGSATATISGGETPYTYLWNTSPAQTDSIAKSLLQGIYKVTITDNIGCSITDSVKVSFFSSVNIKEVINSSSINIYPIPVSNKFTIEIDNLKESYNLEIVNTTGQVVLNKKITNSIEQVDLSGQAAGVYFVKLQSLNNSVVRKIVKQ